MANVSIPSVFSIHRAFNSSAKELISNSNILLHKYSQFNSCHTAFLHSLQIWCEKQPGPDDFCLLGCYGLEFGTHVLPKLQGMTFQADSYLHIHWHENLTSQLLQITFQIGEV